jgi:hypothetical protein
VQVTSNIRRHKKVADQSKYKAHTAKRPKQPYSDQDHVKLNATNARKRW